MFGCARLCITCVNDERKMCENDVPLVGKMFTSCRPTDGVTIGGEEDVLHLSFVFIFWQMWTPYSRSKPFMLLKRSNTVIRWIFNRWFIINFEIVEKSLNCKNYRFKLLWGPFLQYKPFTLFRRPKMTTGEI